MTQPRKPARRPAPKRNNKAKKKANKAIDLYLGIGIFGILAGVIMIVLAYPDTIITVGTIFMFVFIFGIVINLAMLPLVLKKNTNGKSFLKELGIPFFTILNFAGGGALLTGIFLMLNLAGRSADIHTETYEFGKRDPNYYASTYSGVIYTLIDNQRPDEIELRWFDLKHIGTIVRMKHLQWKFSDGLFGIEIFESRGFVSDMEGSDYQEVPLLGDGFQD